MAFEGSTLTLHFGKVSLIPTSPADSSAAGYHSWLRSNLEMPHYTVNHSQRWTTQRKACTTQRNSILNYLECSLEEAAFVTYRPLGTQGWEYRLFTSPERFRSYLAASLRSSTQETDRAECVCSSAKKRRLQLEWRSKRKFFCQQIPLGPWNMPYFDLTRQEQFCGLQCWLGCLEVRLKGDRFSLYWRTRLGQLFESIWLRLTYT